MPDPKTVERHGRTGFLQRAGVWRAGALLLGALMAVTAASARATDVWGEIPTISPSTTYAANRLCYTDGRDIACNAAAGLITTSGSLVLPGSFTAGSIGTGAINASGAISANVISVTALQIVSQSTSPVSCNSGNSGTLRYNSPTTTIELCNGSGWIPMGVGVPADTISAFASTTCPTGWSETYGPHRQDQRGRFVDWKLGGSVFLIHPTIANGFCC